MCEKKPAQA